VPRAVLPERVLLVIGTALAYAVLEQAEMRLGNSSAKKDVAGLLSQANSQANSQAKRDLAGQHRGCVMHVFVTQSLLSQALISY